MTTLHENAPVPQLHLTEGEIRFYREDGYLYIPGLVTPEVVSRLREDVLGVMQEIGAQAKIGCTARRAKAVS